MIDTAPTGLFLFIGLMTAAAFWIFSVPEAPGSTPEAPSDPAPPPAP
jgi:hypothetical protein